MEITQEIIDIVCRQTTYTEDESREKLRLHNHDPIKVIHEYMSFQKKEEPKLSANQKFYSEIRGFMKTSYEQRPDNLKL